MFKVARNIVIGGYLQGSDIRINGNDRNLVIDADKKYNYCCEAIDPSTVESYKLISEEFAKDAASAVVRAGIGAAVFGTPGLLAGMSAKEDRKYTVAIYFKSAGKKSLIEIDEHRYNVLLKSMF